MNIEPRTTPTIEDLEVWLEATRRLLSVPQRVVKHRNEELVCATELSMLESMVRARSFAGMKVPHQVIVEEIKLLSRRLAEVLDLPVTIRLLELAPGDQERIAAQKRQMDQIEVLPCPYCREVPRYEENHAGAWRQHSRSGQCFLSGMQLRDFGDVKKWNERGKREQLPAPPAPDDADIYWECDEDRNLMQRLLVGTAPCRFCHTRLVYREEYGIATLFHPQNGCILGEMVISDEYGVKGWNGD